MRRLAPLLLGVAALVLTAAAGEALLRRLDPPPPLFYEPDPDALYRLRSGARARYHYPWLPPGVEVDVSINSRGFRGAELPAHKAGRRVAVYGDSFVEARSTRIEDTFAARLEGVLRGRRRAPLDVVNAGVTGYGPDQVLARLERDLGLLDPDLLIVVLYAGNDFGDVVRDGLYRLDARGRLQQSRPSLAEPLRAAFAPPHGWRALALARAASRLRAAVRAGSAAAAAQQASSTEALLDECHREYDESLRPAVVVTNLFRDHYDADVSVLPRSYSAAYKRDLMAAILAELGRVARARSMPLLLVAVPAGSDISEADPHRVDAARFPEYRPQALTDTLDAAARAAGLPLVNLFDPFRARQPAPLYYPLDGHWNTAAQALAADLVADRIDAEGLLR